MRSERGGAGEPDRDRDQTGRPGRRRALAAVLRRATAWHHNVLSPELQAMALEEELLPLVEAFCIEELMPLLARGGFVDPAKRTAMAAQVAKYSGLSETAVLQAELYSKALEQAEGHGTI